MVLPFEIEHSNFICEQRKDRGLGISLHFCFIPSQFKIGRVQILAIFKSQNFGVFFDRQLILRATQTKNAKSTKILFLYTSRSVQILHQNFSIYKNGFLKWSAVTFFNEAQNPEIQACKVVAKLQVFSKSCQKSPNCHKIFSRSAMNCPRVGQPPPGI